MNTKYRYDFKKSKIENNLNPKKLLDDFCTAIIIYYNLKQGITTFHPHL